MYGHVHLRCLSACSWPMFSVRDQLQKVQSICNFPCLCQDPVELHCPSAVRWWMLLGIGGTGIGVQLTGTEEMSLHYSLSRLTIDTQPLARVEVK